MNQGALALIVHGGTENWSPERWKDRFDEFAATGAWCSGPMPDAIPPTFTMPRSGSRPRAS